MFFVKIISKLTEMSYELVYNHQNKVIKNFTASSIKFNASVFFYLFYLFIN